MFIEGGFEHDGLIDGEHHSDEVGGVGGLRFGHDVGTVIGDGLGGDSKGGADHFVGLALHEKLDEGGLARGEGFEAFSDFVDGGEVLLAEHVAADDFADAFDDILGIEGLLDEIDGTEFEGFDGGGDIGVAADDDDGELDFAKAEALDEFEAAHEWELEVEEEAADVADAVIVEEAGGIGVGSGAKVCAFESTLQDAPCSKIIVDDINRWHTSHDGLSLRAKESVVYATALRRIDGCTIVRRAPIPSRRFSRRVGGDYKALPGKGKGSCLSTSTHAEVRQHH